MKINEQKYYEEIKNWDFSTFNIISEKLTNWDLYSILRKITNKNSRILDLGTGGGEKLLKYFPEVSEILGTDYSEAMIKTAKENLLQSGRKNITFKVMDNLLMDVPDKYYDVVVARNTPIDAKQIYYFLKEDGHLLVHGVDKYDCYELKLIFGKGQAFKDTKPISIIDYENIISAGFKDVELIPIHVREYFKTRESLYNFLLKVPIIDDFSEEQGDIKNHHQSELDEEKLNKYIERNTYPSGIRLVRRYYGIYARK